MAKKKIGDWEINDWDGDFRPDARELDGTRDLELTDGNVYVTQSDCCWSDRGSPMSCSLAVPVDVLVEFLRMHGYQIRNL